VNQRILMKGNEAIAEAAVRAGCGAYFRLSYYTAERADRVDGTSYAGMRQSFCSG
jgi:hypothetical protein